VAVKAAHFARPPGLGLDGREHGGNIRVRRDSKYASERIRKTRRINRLLQSLHLVFDSKYYNPLFTTAGTDFSSTRAPQTGWVAGAGLEYAVTDHWSIKGEYLHVGVPNKTFASGTPSPFLVVPVFVNYNHTITNEIDIGRFGINYKF
jgi:opacity protein-like surface antigen